MELVFLIPIAFFATVAFVIKWILDYSRWKREHEQGGASEGGSLGTSELVALIREAVEDANEPLIDRIEALEERLDILAQPRLTAGHPSLLDELPEVDESESLSMARPQRVS